MINKIQIKKFSNSSELKELTQETKQFITYLIFFDNASGNLKINHRETPIKQFTIANLPILSTIKYDEIGKKTFGWSLAFDKEARDILLTHSFKLFCPFTGVANVNIEQSIFEKIKFYLQEIQNEILTEKLTFSEIIYLQTALIIKYISRNIADNNSLSQVDDSTLKLFADTVNDEYKNNHGIEFYTGKIGVNTKKLTRLTRQKLNITPKQIIQYRIDAEVIRLLIHSNQSIKEIAYDLNFSSPDYFNYFFKKLNKISPSAYKNMMSENIRFLS